MATARTSVDRSGLTRPTSRPPIRRRGSTKELRQGVQAGLSGPCAGRESQRPDRGARATQADGHAERDAALLMLVELQNNSSQRITVGADKAYDAKNFIAGARSLNVTPHVQKNEKGRRSKLDQRTTRHAGYAISLSRLWLFEKTFGWLKQTGPLAQVKLRGLAKVDWIFVFSCAPNLLRLPRLLASHTRQGAQQQCA